MKRISAFILAIAMIASLMAGCGSKTPDPVPATVDSTNQVSTSAPEVKEPVKLSWMTWEYTALKPQLDGIVKTVKDKFNIDLSIDNIATDQYENSVKIRFASGELNDLLGVHSVQSSYGNMLVKQGALADMSGSAVNEEYLPVATELAKIDGKQYFISNNGAVLGVFYNKKVFSDLSLSVPKTRVEFDAVCDKIKAAKIVPLANGYKDGWTVQIIPFIAITQAFQTEDHDALKKFGNGTLKYTDPKMIEALGTINEFAKKGYYQDKFIGQDFLTAAAQVATGKAAMMINGNWVYKNITDANKDADIGFFALPLVKDGEQITLPGSFDGGVAVNEKSKDLDAAKKVWECYYGKEVQQQIADTGAIQPTNKNCTLKLQINIDIQNAMKSAGYVSSTWHGTYQPNGLNDVMWKGLQGVMAGHGTVESVAAEMEKFNADAVAKAGSK